MDRRSFLTALTSVLSAILGGFEKLLRHSGLATRDLAETKQYTDFFEGLDSFIARDVGRVLIAARKFRERYGYPTKVVQLHLPEAHWRLLCHAFAEDVRRYVGQLTFLTASPEQLLRDYFLSRYLTVQINESLGDWPPHWAAELYMPGDERTEFMCEARRRFRHAIAADTVLPLLRTYA